MLKPVSRDTLTRQAMKTLRRFILVEELECGVKLPSERELSETLAVSRNIVREALSALSAEGLVVKQAGKGTFVGEFDRDEAMQMLPLADRKNGPTAIELREARAVLEMGAAGLIVQRITDHEIEELDKIHKAYEKKHKEGKSPIKEDIDFHLALRRATKNVVIEQISPLVIDVFRRTLSEDASPLRHNPARIVQEHQRIVQALRDRDIAAARAAMHDHFKLQDFPA